MRNLVCAAVTTLFLLSAKGIYAQSDVYFPPVSGNDWETLSPDSLGWCPEKIESLLNFVEDTDGRAFIILKDGRIVLESYMNGFTPDSMWYWASAGKTITAALVGIAQEEGHLDIHNPVADYLGTGWTDCPAGEELERTVFHQLTMSSGFNEALLFWDCTDPECFNCFYEPGEKWHYHNGVYRRLIEVVEESAETTRNLYTTQKIKNKIGMQGFWFDNLFISRARDMARFGLLALNDFVWDGDPVINDTAYVNAMRSTALPANPAYGYLWWLNGKDHFYAPLIQQQQPGWILPSAPADMYAGMGANDQRMYVVPSQGLTVVRMGEVAFEASTALSGFDDQLWQYISDLACDPLTAASTDRSEINLTVFPNPSPGVVSIANPEKFSAGRIFNMAGIRVWEGTENDLSGQINLRAGVYVMEADLREGGKRSAKIVVF
ncbi:MAG: serine hydrolase [Flavobacteriales bacterium]|nr:serine hydrolase [Flavobacteriales bacterium]